MSTNNGTITINRRRQQVWSLLSTCRFISKHDCALYITSLILYYVKNPKVINNLFSGGSRFPRLWVPTPKMGHQPIIWLKFSNKTAWKWKKLDREGASVLGSVNVFAVFVCSMDMYNVSVLFLLHHHAVMGFMHPSLKIKVENRCRPVQH